MKVTDLNLLFADCETLRGYSLFSFYDPIADKWFEFHINEYRNDLYSLLKFLDDYKDHYFVFFNGLKFDGQVIQAVLRRHKRWLDYTNFEVSRTIWQIAQDIIDLTSNDLFPPYREDSLAIKIIDVFEIPHFSNRSKRTSLKWLEFMMDFPNIEEMPYHHTKEKFTPDEIGEIATYCRNDIVAMMQWWEYLNGNSNNEFYKANKVQDRLDIIEELGLPEITLSYSDVKIGDEMNKLGYCKLTGSSISDIYEAKRKRGPTKRFKFKQCIPEYVIFKTPELIDFYNKVKDEYVSLADTDKQEFPLEYRGTKYTIARGGIHSCEKNRVVVPLENEILRDADIGSQYPNSIVKRELFPSHLGKEWLINYKKTINTRIECKRKSKDNPKYKGLSEMYKLALNGGGFGMTNQRFSWQYDPRVTYFCTIGNQFEILMLIEMLEIQGIHVISANTDGIVCLFKKNQEEQYYKICNEWEKVVGNSEMGKLEYSDLSLLAQESVNHYVIVKSDGEVKIKGRFAYEVELNKNNTDKIGRIERKAIVKYFSKGIPIEDTINSSTNIYDFCLGLKSSSNYHFQTIDRKDSTVQEYKKVIRFYISYTDHKLIKVKNENAVTRGAKITRIADGYYVTMFNKFERKSFGEYRINYDFYIDRAKSIIDKIEKNRKNKKFKEVSKEQLKLF